VHRIRQFVLSTEVFLPLSVPGFLLQAGQVTTSLTDSTFLSLIYVVRFDVSGDMELSIFTGKTCASVQAIVQF
jgi:hypothetical protein